MRASWWTSSIHRMYTYMVKCLSSHCLGCPKKVKIVEDLNKDMITVYDAAGWPHDHEGEFSAKRGLPPPIKAKLDAKMKEAPRIKPSVMCHYLFDVCGFSPKYKGRVQIFMHNHYSHRLAPILGCGQHTSLKQLCHTEATH